MTSRIIIPFCFFMAFFGFTLVLFPFKRTKTGVKISFVYSFFFFLVGIYMSYTLLFPSKKWEKKDDGTYYNQCNPFQEASFIPLDENDFTSFPNHDEKLIDMYKNKGTRCLMHELSEKQEKLCRRIARSLIDNYSFNYGLLIVSESNAGSIYLVKYENDYVSVSDFWYVLLIE